MHEGWKKKGSSEITIDPKANPYDCPSIVLWPSCRAEGINSSHQTAWIRLRPHINRQKQFRDIFRFREDIPENREKKPVSV